jgi:hypothetical protein
MTPSSNRILSIHQPNFIPWLGYFDKMAKSDIFVILDNVQYPRSKSVANRNKIKSPTEVLELVVPVSKPSGYEGKVSYQMVNFAEKFWYEKILKTIKHNYSKAEYFERYFPTLEKFFSMDSFCNMNIEFINFVRKEFELDTELILQSSVNEDLGNNNQMIVNLCKLFDANVYLSGIGAREYNDEGFMNQNGITLEYQNFIHPTYPQLWGDFVPYLSTIDLLFNCGPEGKRALFGPGLNGVNFSR